MIQFRHLLSVRALFFVVLLWVVPNVTTAQTNIFFTQFETTKGYDPELPLVGQNGWIGEGSGGCGFVTEYIEGQGQQAYLGYSPPMDDDFYLAVWRPLNFDPLAANLPRVKFSVLLSIEDSSVDSWDYFRWSVYTREGHRLFSVEFDNYYRDLAYQLDGTNDWVYTPVTYDNAQPYTLTFTMDFAANCWSASLDHQLIATNQPLTTTSAPLNLGDVDAIWILDDPRFPGDNYMLFDNYRVTAEQPAPPPPQLQLLGRTGAGEPWLRLTGAAGVRFAIDATTNLQSWTALKTNVLYDGVFDFVDTGAPGAPQRFYRARWVP